MSTAATFRAQTGKRKFSDPFEENGDTWILDSQGHQWCWVEYDGAFEWERFTDDDDAFVIETKQAKRAKRTDPLTSRERINLGIAEASAACREWAQREGLLTVDERADKARAFDRLDSLYAQREKLPA